MKAKKIWHLISNRWFSAITAYAINAAKALEIHGHQCVFSPIKNTPGEVKALENNLNTISFPGFGLPQFIRFLSLFRSIKPDVIILYGGPEEFLCKFLPKNSSVIILRFQGNALRSKSQKSPWLFEYSHKHIDLLLCPSKRISHAFKGFKNLPPVSTVSLGVDTGVFKPHPQANPFNHSKRPEVLIFGRLDPIKGHKEFISIFAQFLRKWPPTKDPKLPVPCLHIVGLPANISQDQLERDVKTHELKLGEDVLVTCHKVDDPALLLSNACLGVVPSLGSEEICRVAQEFLLCGTPVFVSGVGALEEVLFVGAGESYKGKSKSDVALQLQKLIEKSITETSISRDLRASMAKNLFSLHSMGARLINEINYLSK
ncbi:MAG: glycosyltransferase family 4 protein [Oligoflexales bacterium]|nr:glycosyltransferase family 4 protein [Oligoflexales bacterium]